MKTFKRNFSVDVSPEDAVDLTKKSLDEQGIEALDLKEEVTEDFLGQKTRIVTVTTDE